VSVDRNVSSTKGCCGAGDQREGEKQKQKKRQKDKVEVHGRCVEVVEGECPKEST